MKSWDLTSMSVSPRAPEILESVDGGHAIVLEIPAGESLQDHQVHEHAWVTVICGEVEFTTDDQAVSGGAGLMVEFPHAIGVVQHQADVPDPADARLRAGSGARPHAWTCSPTCC